MRGDFDTLQLFDDDGKVKARIPRMFGDKEGMPLEPFTKAYSEYGKGGAVQMHYDFGTIKFKNVVTLPEK